MTHTLRRDPWGREWEKPGRWLKRHRDKTCRPGCLTCGDAARQKHARFARMRQQGKRQILEQLKGL